MIKTVKVVILPTDGMSHIYKGTGDMVWFPVLEVKAKGFRDPHHLYLTSYNEIEKGEYGIYKNIVVKILSVDRYEYQVYAKDKIAGYVAISKVEKIIATTDTDINEPNNKRRDVTYAQLPNISKEFMKEYVKSNGKIDKVDIEYKIYKAGEKGKQRLYDTICINANNEVIIVPKEKRTSAQEEMGKCKNSPYYFYTNYFMVDGEKATTHLSEKDFNEQWKHFENN